MDIGAHSRIANTAAQSLLVRLEAEHPGFASFVLTHGARPAAEELLGITVHVVESAGRGCSVAGSSDAAARTVTVTRASPERMRFTALHEVAHVEGADDDEFQQILLDSALTRRDVEEDACEAFAAALLLPDDRVDAVLDDLRRTAKGLVGLIDAMPQVSREACAVAVAHRLDSPGYVALVEASGELRFAARSGDVLPLRRGSEQGDSDLRQVSQGAKSYRGPGQLCFPNGSKTNRLNLDVERRGELIYVVAVTDTPDWPHLHQPDRSSATDNHLEGWCVHCSVDFTSTRRCPMCGDAIHATCGLCSSCGSALVQGERMCLTCFLIKPPRCFPDPLVDICEEH